VRKTAAKVNVLPARLLSALIGLVLSYNLGTRAIDTGSYWQYLGCLVFLGLSISLIIGTFKKNYGKHE
jgi:hypothetical protein